MRYATLLVLFSLCRLGEIMAASTVNDFDSPGTPFAAATYLSATSPALISGGPTGKYLQLIDNTKSSRNSVWFDQTEESLASKITTDFDYKIFGGIRGDGLAFGLASVNFFGSSGAENPTDGEDVFDEKGRLEESIAIAFDTYENPGHGDPNNNSVSLHFNEQLIATFDPGFDLHSSILNGFDHASVDVEFVPTGAEINLVLTPFGSNPHIVIDSYLLAGVSPYVSRAVFGARTGEDTAYFVVDSLNVDYVPEPATIALSLGFVVLLSRTRRKHIGRVPLTNRPHATAG